MKKIEFKISFSPIHKVSFKKLGKMVKIILNTSGFGHRLDSLFYHSEYGVLVGTIIEEDPEFWKIKLYTGKTVIINVHQIFAYYPVEVTIATIEHGNPNFKHSIGLFEQALLHDLNTEFEGYDATTDENKTFELLYTTLWEKQEGGRI